MVHDKNNGFTETKRDSHKREEVTHPSRYNQYPVETIEAMRRVFGNKYTYIFVIMTAFKYRMRVGFKDDVMQDLAKEAFYLEYANMLKAKKLKTPI